MMGQELAVTVFLRYFQKRCTKSSLALSRRTAEFLVAQKGILD
jgi:hypothetical protein